MPHSAYDNPYPDPGSTHRTNRITVIAASLVSAALLAEPVCAVVDLRHVIPIGLLATVTVSLLTVGGIMLAARPRVPGPQEVTTDAR